MRIRLVLFGLWLLALAVPTSAQQLGLPTAVSVQDSGTACSVANTCAVFANANQAISLTLSVTGTFSGTLTFEATADGSTWFSVLAVNTATGAQATTTTATGLFAYPNAGYVSVRARGTAWSSGTATVTAVRGFGNARLLSPIFPNSFFANALCVDATNQDVCVQRQASGILNLTAGVAGTTFTRLNFGTAISTNPALKRNSNTQIIVRQADDSADANWAAGAFNSSAGYQILGNTLFSATAPTISSGFGSSPAILSSNGAATFRVNVGTGGVATSGVVGMPTATTGWNCQVTDLTNNTVTRETASSVSSVTVTAAAAWAASDTLIFNCAGF